MTLTAHKVANVLSIVELIALFVGGSIVASFAIGSSLILLLGVTLGWLVLLLIEQAALRHGTRNLLIVCGAFRLVGMTAICMAPIVLAPYHSQDSGTYLVVLGGLGVVLNPVKGVVLLKASRNTEKD